MATIQGGGFEFSTPSVHGLWRWTVRANNLQGLGQVFEVAGVETPFGPLLNAQIPIPGEVVQAMAQSIMDLQEQLAPLIGLVQPAITSFVITVTEGDPDMAVGSVSVQNVGAFGSFMTATATPSVPWLGADPPVVQGVGKNERETFNISLLTALLFSSTSPYAGVVNLQDNRSPPSVIPVAVTVLVLPRPVIMASPSQAGLTFILSTGTPGVPSVLTVMNSGPVSSSLSFSVAKLDNNSPWLDITPVSGGPLAGGQSAGITLSVIVAGAPRTPGMFTERVRVSSPNATNGHVDVTVTLTVT